MLGKQIRGVIDIQREWLVAGVPVFRYEDLWADPQGQFARIFEFCRLDVCRLRRQYLVCRQSFALRTFWRLGRPNPSPTSAGGAPGDWKSHFCNDLKRSFDDRW